MPILNYTTTIKSSKTVGEIQAKLAKAGATSLMVDYEGGEPASLSFLISISGTMVSFRLPSQWHGVLKSMERDRKVPRSKCNEEQARRVAWRIVKDWVEAQLAIIEADIADLAEVFLPYAVTDTGETLYQAYLSRPDRLLGSGENSD